MLEVLKESAAEWNRDEAPRLGAALAFYTVLSLAPMLVLALVIVGAVWGNEAGLQAQLVAQTQQLVGPQGADAVATILRKASGPGGGSVLATVLGVATLLFGATGVFAQLQGALNAVWDVRRRPGMGLRGFVRTRLLSFAMILIIGTLLLAFSLTSTLLDVLGTYLAGQGIHLRRFLWALDLGVSFGVITLLFAMIYRILPDVEIRWRQVWGGAAVTALLFVGGKWGLSTYLSYTSTASAYGAAGSLVVLLVWIYYSAQIFFFGAELTQVAARRYGEALVPSAHAYRLYNKEVNVQETTEPATNGRQEEAPATRPLPPSPRPGRYVVAGLVTFVIGLWWGRKR